VFPMLRIIASLQDSRVSNVKDYCFPAELSCFLSYLGSMFESTIVMSSTFSNILEALDISNDAYQQHMLLYFYFINGKFLFM